MCNYVLLLFILIPVAGYLLQRYLEGLNISCLLYTSDAADDLLCVDLGGRRIIKKKKQKNNTQHTHQYKTIYAYKYSEQKAVDRSRYSSLTKHYRNDHMTTCLISTIELR